MNANGKRLPEHRFQLRFDLCKVFGHFDVAEHASDECVDDVEAVQSVSLVDRQIKRRYGDLVRLRQAKRRLQIGEEIGYLDELDELRGVWVVALPGQVELRVVVVGYSDLFQLVSFVKVLQYDGDVPNSNFRILEYLLSEYYLNVDEFWLLTFDQILFLNKILERNKLESWIGMFLLNYR